MTALHATRTVALALLLVNGAAAIAHGQMFVATGRDTLRGLPGVEVVMEAVQAELDVINVSGAALRSEVANRLRARGITVYASQSDNPSPAKPYLYLELNVLPLPGGGAAVAVQFHLRQTLKSPVTNSNIVDAMTWDQHTIVAVPAATPQAVHSVVQEQIDLFIEDWLAVHE